MVERWQQLFVLPSVVADWYNGVPQSKALQVIAKQRIKLWRKRLFDLGWFMRCINEPIARRANKEDGCSGRFWQGRYKSQALLDEQALLACMVYVDLNPIRANMAQTLPDSDFTSVQARIKKTKLAGLVEFDTAVIDMSDLTNTKLPFTLTEYLDLVDWSGRIIREDKAGYISSNTPSILDRLEIEPDLWAEHLCDFKDKFHTVVGPIDRIKSYCQKLKKNWVWGMNTNAQFYARPR